MLDALHAFHFLRPWWLLGLLPIIYLSWKLYRLKQQQGAWQSVIDPDFKRVLLPDAPESQPVAWPILGLGLMGFVLVFALAGPAWQEVKLPAEKNRQASVVVLDLSLSMLADDLKPNRLTRVRYKLTDYLQAHPEHAIGMVGYAGSAHTIVPIAADATPLLNLLPTLDPLMMPAFGSDPLAAMQQAETLFKGSHIKDKHLIWITDDLELHQIAELQQFFAEHPMQVSILMVGTAKGGPVAIPNQGLLKDDQGQIILPQLPAERLQTLAESIAASLMPITLDQRDLDSLLPNFAYGSQQDENDTPQNRQAWLDMGAWLLWGLLPLAALAFRRGWLFSGLWLPAILLPFIAQPQPTWAEIPLEDALDQHNAQLWDAFKSPDQQGYEHWQQGNFANAEDRFESQPWKGASAYRMKNYQQAAKAFALDPSAQGQYNLGNALAHLGQFKEAKTAYQAALKQDPQLQVAKENLALVEALLKPKPQDKPQDKNQSNKPDQNGGSQSTSPTDQPSEDQQPKATSKDSDDNSEQAGNSQANANHRSQGSGGGLKDEAMPQAKPSDSTKPNGEPNTAKPSASKPKQTEQAAHSSDGPNQPTQDQNKDQNKDQTDSDSAQATADTDTLLDSEDQAGTAPSQLAKSDKDLTEAQWAQQSEQQAKKEAEQAKQAWLRQIPDEPGLFLKRKFDYQYQTQEARPTPTKQW